MIQLPWKAKPRGKLTHDLASFGDITKFSGEVQKSGLVFDDVLIKTCHGDTPWAVCPVDGCVDTSIKTETPFPFKGFCQIKSKLTQLTWPA